MWQAREGGEDGEVWDEESYNELLREENRESLVTPIYPELQMMRRRDLANNTPDSRDYVYCHRGKDLI